MKISLKDIWYHHSWIIWILVANFKIQIFNYLHHNILLVQKEHSQNVQSHLSWSYYIRQGPKQTIFVLENSKTCKIGDLSFSYNVLQRRHSCFQRISCCLAANGALFQEVHQAGPFSFFLSFLASILIWIWQQLMAKMKTPRLWNCILLPFLMFCFNICNVPHK